MRYVVIVPFSLDKPITLKEYERIIPDFRTECATHIYEKQDDARNCFRNEMNKRIQLCNEKIIEHNKAINNIHEAMEDMLNTEASFFDWEEE